MIPVIQADAAKIGITFTVRPINGAYTTIQTTNKNIPFSERPGWGKDYADPYTFFGELFDSRAIIPSGNTNYSLVGITPADQHVEEARRDGQPERASRRSTPTSTPARRSSARHRTTCWENLDKKLMTQVVPWVPYLWSNNVTIVGPNGHALELRPVQRRHRLLAGVGQAVTRHTTGVGRDARPTPTPRPHEERT